MHINTKSLVATYVVIELFFMSFFEAVDAGSFVSGILWNDVMFDDGLLLWVIVRQKSGW